MEEVDPVQEEELSGEKDSTAAEMDARLYQRLDQHMQWKYPYDWKRRLPARLSVSRIKDASEEEEQVRFMVPDVSEEASGAQVGTALHTALSRMDLKRMESREQIEAQLAELQKQGILTEEEKKLVSVEQLVVYASSELASRMKQAEVIMREQPFIVQFTIGELREIVPGWMPELEHADAEERIMVQGMIDCCFIEKDQWVLVDYKSDRYINEQRLSEYKRQLRLYRKALENVTGISVTETILYQTRKGSSLRV